MNVQDRELKQTQNNKRKRSLKASCQRRNWMLLFPSRETTRGHRPHVVETGRP